MRGHGPRVVARRRALRAAIVVAALAMGGDITSRGFVLGAEEPQELDSGVRAGEDLYADHCSKCHGESGAGDGELGAWLETKPSDLTVLSRAHDGIFPFDEVLATIDGTEVVEGHRVSDMPVWREVFKLKDRDASVEEIEEKLRALTAYVRSLQRPGEPE